MSAAPSTLPYAHVVHELVLTSQVGAKVKLYSFPVKGGYDYIRSIRRGERSINHIPAPRDIQGFFQTVEVELSNEEVVTDLGTATVSEWLLQILGVERLEGVQATWTEYAGTQVPPGFVLSTLPAGELRFTGQITQVETEQRSQISLQLASTLPQLTWGYAVGPKTDPRDFGKRLQVPIGTVKNLPVINYQVGAVTTLTATLAATYTGLIGVTDASGFDASGQIQINREVMSFTKQDEKTLTITGRAVQGADTDHLIGSQVTESLTETIFVVSGFSGSNFIGLKGRDSNGNLIDLPFGSFDDANSGLISGEILSTVTMTQADLYGVGERLSLFSEGGNYVPPGTPTISTQQPNNNFTFAGDPVTWNEDSFVDDGGASGIIKGENDIGATGIQRAFSGLPTSATDVIEYRWRWSFHTTGASPGQTDLSLRVRDSGGWPVGAAAPATYQTQLNNVPATITWDTFANFPSGWTPWATAGTGNKLEDFNGASFACDVGFNNFAITGVQTQTFIEVEFKLAGTPEQLDENTINSGFGLELYSDIDGYADIGELTPRYTFDDPLGWNVSEGVHLPITEGQFEGTQSQAVVVGTTVVDTVNDAANWTSESL